MKFLLLGHKGYLGSYLYHNLLVDILSERNIYGNGKQYDYVINCIGKPDVEYCENHLTETNYSNWLVIKDIIKYYPNAKIINFSSYYVYDEEGLCNENANTTDRYAYMRQKLNAEQLIKNGVTFRLGKLFGNKEKNQNKSIDYILQNDNLILDSVLFNPTSVNQVLKIIEYELDNHSLNGIFNLSNLGIVSSYELGIYINELLGTKKSIEKIEKMNRFFHNYGKFVMDVSKLNSIYSLTDWKKDFKDYILC
jgi:dTDP-4-dehydrorhamnose reductase